MTIQTKYNIGQSVWIITQIKGETKAQDVEIIGVGVHQKYQSEPNVCYDFYFNGERKSMNERFFFETKEKLAESIINS